MTDTHNDFLPASGAIIIVICSAANVVSHDPRAFERQANFAQDIMKRVEGIKSLANAPIILLLVSNGSARQSHESTMHDFPTLVTLNDYSTAALANAARVLFGK